MDSDVARGLRSILGGVLLSAVIATSAFAQDAADALDGASPDERVAKAVKLAETDPAKVMDAFGALRSRKFKKGEVDPHLDFIAAYVTQQSSRVLRLAALSVGAKHDAAGTAARIRPQADGTDRLKSSLAAECLGYVGDEEDWDTLVKLANSSSVSIAVRACEALAKMGGKDQAEQLMEIALEHPNVEVADHATWAALDILKKQKTVLGKMKKAVGRDAGSPRAIRFAAIEAMLADGAEPYKWGKPLDDLWKLRDAMDPDQKIAIDAVDTKRREKVEAALEWIGEKAPGTRLLIEMSVKSINFPGSPSDAHIDLAQDAVCVPLSYVGQNERQLAYHLVRVATVLFEKRIGNPYVGHRGWENAIFDTYDVCALAGLYNAGDGGINRDQFLDQIIGTRPWGGN